MAKNIPGLFRWLGWGLLAMSTLVHADILSYSTSSGALSTNWGDTNTLGQTAVSLSVPKFKPVLGGLTSVSMQLAGTVVTTAAVQNPTGSAVTLSPSHPATTHTYSSQAGLFVYEPPDVNQPQLVVATPSATSNIPSNTVVAAGATVNLAALTATLPVSNTACSAAACTFIDTWANISTLFSGTGNIQLPAKANGQGSVNIPNGLTYVMTATAKADVTVAYTYTPNAPSLTKSFSPAGIPVNGSSTLSITLYNYSSAAATSAAFTDTLPTSPNLPAVSGAVVVAATPSANNGCGGTFNPTGGAGSVSLSGGTIPAATINGPGSCTVTVNVTSATGSVAGTVYTNTIPAGALTSSLRPNTSPATANLTVFSGSISGRVWQDGGATNLGTYQSGTDTIFGTAVEVDLYKWNGTAYALLTSTTTNTTDGTYSFTGLAPGTYKVVEPTQPTGTTNGVTTAGTITGSGGGAAGTANNTTTTSQITAIMLGSAAVTGVVDSSPDNNFAEVPLTAPNLTKAFSPTSIAVNGTSVLTLTLSNTNGAAATLSTDLVDPLPANVVLAASPAATTSCTGGTVTAVGSATSFKLGAGAKIPANGSCTVTVTVTSAVAGGYTNTIPAGNGSTTGLNTDVGNGPQAQAPLTVTAAVLASITGKVYVDVGGTTAYGAPDGDRLLSGVTITLTAAGGGACGLASCTTTTAADGTYSFSGLVGGTTYEVHETQPALYSNFGSNGSFAGTVGGTTKGSRADGAPNDITGIILAAGDVGVNYDFREASASLAGKVFLDNGVGTGGISNNGIQDGTEAGIAGVTVTLNASGTGKCPDGTTTACTATTAVDGSYSFVGLPAGTYSLVESQPAAYSDGKETAGTAGGMVDNTGFDATAAHNGITAISLTAGVASTANNFADLPVVITPPSVVKAFSPADIPVGGRSVLTITLNNTNATAATLTSALVDTLPANLVLAASPIASPAGTCSGTVTAVAGAATASYASGASIPSGGCTIKLNVTSTVVGAYTNTIPAQALKTDQGNNPNPTSSTLTVHGGAISGKVFKDVGSSNGSFESGTDLPLSGVPVQLFLKNGGSYPGTPTYTTTTDSNGDYSFSGLPPGVYKLVEPTQPDNTKNGVTTAGSVTAGNGGAVGTATDASTLPSAITDLTLGYVAASGVVDTSIANNFAELGQGSISGKVYHDVNKNGAQDSGEPGLGLIVLTLSGTDDLGRPVSLTTTTSSDGNGTYSFTGLRPGNYTVAETQPAGINDFVGNTGSSVGNIGGTTVGSLPAGPNVIQSITLGLEQNGVRYDFREDASAFLAGYVYLDNGAGGGVVDNGVKDGGEIGIPNVTITLKATGGLAACADGSATCTVTTDAAGKFNFAGLRSGTYSIVETQPIIYSDGRETAGTAGGTVDNSAFDTTATHNSITGVTVGAGTQASGYTFGELNGVVARLSGRVWLNTAAGGSPTTYDPGDTPLEGWIVELIKGDTIYASGATGADGTYAILQVVPDYGYQIRFRNPSSGQIWWGAVVNNPDTTAYVDKADRTVIKQVDVPSGASIGGLDLPVDPSGIVYDSVTGKPVKGAVVTISGNNGFNATNVVGGVLTQTTGSDGLYQFLITNFGSLTTFNVQLSVVPPAGYTSPSTILACTAALHVGVQTPALVQSLEAPPTAAFVAANVGSYSPSACPTTTDDPSFVTGLASLRYYLTFNVFKDLGGSVGSGNVINNHIPLDPILGGSLLMTKTTPLVNVARGDLVPYTLTAANRASSAQTGVAVVDNMPPGFKYRQGSATVDGVPTEPAVAGSYLSWSNQNFAATGSPAATKVYKLLLMVGSGVSDGQYTNQTWAQNSGGSMISNIATATVRVVPDPTFDCPDVIGKVFDDKNANGYQDEGEPGIPNVRIATVRGLLVTTDAEGRFHVPCPEMPNEDRGSNFVMKLDDRTLPSGYRLTTENPRDVRITRGKLVKLNFGATIHRVVRIELTDAAFESGKETLMSAWQKKIEALPRQLTDKPSLIRLAYLQTADDELKKKRVKALKEQLQKRWQDLNCCYMLVIETEGEGAQ